MVVEDENPRRLFASIWSAAVANGTGLALVPSFSSMLFTVYLAPTRLSSKFSAFLAVSGLSPSKTAGNVVFLPSLAKSPVTLKLDLPWNFSISRSFSTTRRNAGLCTRPAEMAPGTFLRTTPDKS